MRGHIERAGPPVAFVLPLSMREIKRFLSTPAVSDRFAAEAAKAVS
ncbi:MAG: hypothetical protein AAGC95_01065 [Pseudomonadota bacterium]